MESTISFDWKNIYFTLQVIIAASATAGILYKVFTFIIKKIKTEYENLSKVHTMVETIYAELTPNHGTSMKDKVNKIADKLETNIKVTECIMYRQRWMLDNRDEPIFESDINGECTWVNSKYCNLTGYTFDEFLKNGWHNVVHAKDRERVVNEWAAAVNGKRDSRGSHRIVCKDGSVYKVHVIATRNADVGYIGSIKVEKRLEENCDEC